MLRSFFFVRVLYVRATRRKKIGERAECNSEVCRHFGYPEHWVSRKAFRNLGVYRPGETVLMPVRRMGRSPDRIVLEFR